ncbi:MAG: TetR family transcriptional regulator [Candidatus Obscuribacterales bacterium]|nr:TetR family transcriptional regulator [Candidatus Obscuribacterales bacterium]
MPAAAKKNKSETTRALILETALRLFRERGFEETTMRGIAEEAGVSLGNAYYYFRSKDEMVHAFYARLQEEQLYACEGILATEKSLKSRISGLIRAQLAMATPYHRLFVSLFKIAADPQNSLNPFSVETKTIRDKCIARFAEVVIGADEKVSEDLTAELPQLLWLYYMGIVLFWIYDRSPGYARTYRLLEMSCDMLSTLIQMASLPLLIPLRKSVLKLLQSIKEI